MEENKKSNGALVVVVLSILLILTSGYIVYDKVFSKSNNANDVNENESIKEVLKCKYTKLKSVEQLTDAEKKEIEEKIEYAFAHGTEKIEKVDDYTYLVSFEYQDADAEGSTVTFVHFWKENGVWQHGDYFGSGYEENTSGQSFICRECGDCNS